MELFSDDRPNRNAVRPIAYKRLPVLSNFCPSMPLKSPFSLKKARLHIDNKGVVVNGRLSDSIFALPVEICLRPKIDQGKLIFVLDDVATRSISLPKFAKDKINAYLDLIMRSKELYDPNLEIISAYTVDKILNVEILRKS